MIIDFHLHAPSDDADFIKRHVALMDEAGVDMTVLHPLPGLPFKGMRTAENDEVARIVAECPERFIGSVYLDPRETQWRDTLNSFVDKAFRCVKMWPPVGFYPDEDRFAPVFEHVASLGLPIVLHAGLTNMGPGYASKYADPIRAEALLQLYPDTPFILAHWGGLGTWQSAWAMMKAHRNLHLDASGRRWCWPGVGLYRLHSEATPLDFTRILWGTDNLEAPADDLANYRALLEEIGHEDHAAAFFGDTAARLLRL